MDPKKMRYGHIVDIGALPLNPKTSAGPIQSETKRSMDQNFNFDPLTVEENKHLPQQNIHVESSNGGLKADDLNPGWSDDEDDGTPLVVAKPKVEIQNGEKPATVVSLKSNHPQPFGQIFDVSPPFPKKDAFKNADRFVPDLKLQVNAVQPPAYGVNQPYSSHTEPGLRIGSSFGQISNGRDILKDGQNKAEEKVVPVRGTDAGVRLYNAVASLKRSELPEKSFIDQKVQDAAIHGSTTFTNDEMRRLATFAKKALSLYTGISDLLIGKAWN